MDGIVKFLLEHITTDDQGNHLYIPSDTSRHVFRFKSGDQIERDVKGEKLLNAFHPSLMDHIKTDIFSYQKWMKGEYEDWTRERVDKYFDNLNEINGIPANRVQFLNSIAEKIIIYPHIMSRQTLHNPPPTNH